MKITVEGRLIDYDTSRFWSKVRKTDTCWLWVGSNNDSGYGTMTIHSRSYRPSRISYAMHKADPIGLKVLHTCDNPKCVNPKHLFLGTDQDNSDDKVAKGRQQKGERHWNNKLTNTERSEILSSSNSISDLADRYGVTPSCIKCLRHRSKKCNHSKRK